MAFEEFWKLITLLGGLEIWVAIIFAILAVYAIVPKSKKHRIASLAFILISSIIVSTVVAELLKTSLKISRPCVGSIDCPSGYSFPSGHAARIFTLAAVIALSIRDFRTKFAFLILAILVSISRVALNYHTYADIIAGALVGILIAYLANLSYKRVSSLKTFKTIIS